MFIVGLSCPFTLFALVFLLVGVIYLSSFTKVFFPFSFRHVVTSCLEFISVFDVVLTVLFILFPLLFLPFLIELALMFGSSHLIAFVRHVAERMG